MHRIKSIYSPCLTIPPIHPPRSQGGPSARLATPSEARGGGGEDRRLAGLQPPGIRRRPLGFGPEGGTGTAAAARVHPQQVLLLLCFASFLLLVYARVRVSMRLFFLNSCEWNCLVLSKKMIARTHSWSCVSVPSLSQLSGLNSLEKRTSTCYFCTKIRAGNAPTVTERRKQSRKHSRPQPPLLPPLLHPQ